MSTLHGFAAKPGDAVFDLIEGQGKILSVDKNSTVVRFGNGHQHRFNTDGLRLTHRPSRVGVTLYWHNPVISIPPKHPKAWDFVKSMVNDIHKKLRDYDA